MTHGPTGTHENGTGRRGSPRRSNELARAQGAQVVAPAPPAAVVHVHMPAYPSWPAARQQCTAVLPARTPR
ncbi:MAG: hypothetical protein ACRDRA_02885 [Pseudonocardiaceae bacterium]